MSAPLGLLRLMRPHQWIKNGFVLTGLVFSRDWTNLPLVQSVLLATLGFSLLSSSVYVANDIADMESDRAHPKKRSRPLAAGLVSVPVAIVEALVLLGVALAAGYAVAIEVVALMGIYALLNVGYTLGLKHIAILDVFIIAAGFMLRILVGTLGVGIEPSKWLLLCGLMVTLFLGFSKRHAELAVVAAHGKTGRKVLDDYDSGLLDKLISITAATTVITYGLYTVSPETIATHGTDALIYTVPFVLYGVIRYVFQMHRHSGGEDPARSLLTDPHLFFTVIGWLLAVVVILA